EPAGPSLPHRDEAAMLERAQRLAHGHAAGPELAHELALGRKLVAMREPALVNRALDLRDDVLVYTGRPNCSEHRCASLSDQRASMSRAGRAACAPTRSAASAAAPRAPAHGKTFVPSRLSPVRHRSDASVTAAHARDTAGRENSRICAWLARCSRAPHFQALSAGFPDRRTDHETDRDVERTARARRSGDGGLRDEGLGQRHVRPETGADG